MNFVDVLWLWESRIHTSIPPLSTDLGWNFPCWFQYSAQVDTGINTDICYIWWLANYNHSCDRHGGDNYSPPDESRIPYSAEWTLPAHWQASRKDQGAQMNNRDAFSQWHPFLIHSSLVFWVWVTKTWVCGVKKSWWGCIYLSRRVYSAEYSILGYFNHNSHVLSTTLF